MDKTYQPSEIEQRIYDRWEEIVGVDYFREPPG